MLRRTYVSLSCISVAAYTQQGPYVISTAGYTLSPSNLSTNATLPSMSVDALKVTQIHTPKPSGSTGKYSVRAGSKTRTFSATGSGIRTEALLEQSYYNAKPLVTWTKTDGNAGSIVLSYISYYKMYK